MDTTAGTEFSQHYRRLDWLLVEHLLDPMVLTTRAYRFEEAVFDTYCRRLENGLLADQIRMVEFLPLNGFVSQFEQVEVTDGLVLRPMTDSQMSAAIRVQAVSGEFGGGPNSVEVSQLNQWALTTERSFPVVSGKQGMPDTPAAPPFPSLEAPANRLVQALRTVCGGSVVATRPSTCSTITTFPPTSARPRRCQLSVRRIWIGPPSCSAPRMPTRYGRSIGCLLTRQCRAIVPCRPHCVASCCRLAQPHRRQVGRPHDRYRGAVYQALRDRQPRQGSPHRQGRKALLTGDPVLGADSDAITEFMRLAYRLRNDEIHGGDPARRSWMCLDGSATDHLRDVVEDIERVMRRAIHRVLVEVAPCRTG